MDLCPTELLRRGDTYDNQDTDYILHDLRGFGRLHGFKCL